MFPPLCFVDIIQDIDIQNGELQEVLSKEEIELLKNGSLDKIPIKIKFKVAEIYKSINSKILKLLGKETEISK